jgi:hypothetical protein
MMKKSGKRQNKNDGGRAFQRITKKIQQFYKFSN